MRSRKTLLALYFITALTRLSFGAFMDPGWGARPTGMGGAFTAVSNDENALIFNPAGLALVTGRSAGAMRAGIFTGLDAVSISLNLFAFTLPLPEPYMGTAGASWTNLTARGLYREDSFILGYGRVINRNLAAGASFKYLGHGYTLDRYAREDPVFADRTYGHAVTADLGLMIMPGRAPERGLRLGLCAQNVIPADVGLRRRDVVPPVARAGISWRFPYLIMMGTVVRDMVPAADISWRFQEWGGEGNKLEFNFGAEAWFLDRTLPVRAGVGARGLSIGAGISHVLAETLRIRADYSFTLPFRVSGTLGSHRLSLTGSF